MLFVVRCLLFLLFTNVAFAVDDPIQVEIIVFENTDKKNVISETWGNYSGELEHKHALDLATTDLVLPEENLQLIEEVLKIKKSRNHRLLLHTGWKHPVSGEQRQGPVYVTSNNVESVWDIEGLVGIKSQQSLYQVQIDFIMKTPLTADKFQDFRLVRTVKVHQKELYYFDHPMFGILLSVMPSDSV
jgi:hypothetical protein